MFRVNEDTTCADLVLMALKKTNLIEDHHSYSIYNIHDTNKGVATCTRTDTYISVPLL